MKVPEIPNRCPECDTELGGVEYRYDDPDHYDGVSEWACPLGHIRYGRWSGKILKDGDWEGRYGGEKRDRRRMD